MKAITAVQDYFYQYADLMLDIEEWGTQEGY